MAVSLGRGKSTKLYQMFLDGKPFRKTYHGIGGIKNWMNQCKHQLRTYGSYRGIHEKDLDKIIIKEFEIVETGLEFPLSDNPKVSRDKTKTLKEIEKI